MKLKDALRKFVREHKRIRSLFHKILKLSPHNITASCKLKRIERLDRKIGTDFSGRIYQDELGVNSERANDYSPSPEDLIRTIKKTNVKGKAIVDMGSGKGYAMWKMLQFPFSKVGGVELSETLCDSARSNLSRLAGNDNRWDIFMCDAGQWEGYDDYDIFYIYNSFPKKVMVEVKECLEKSIKQNKRKVYIWYLNPEYPEVFDDEKWKLLRKGKWWELRNGMHVYTNRL